MSTRLDPNGTLIIDDVVACSLLDAGGVAIEVHGPQPWLIEPADTEALAAFLDGRCPECLGNGEFNTNPRSPIGAGRDLQCDSCRGSGDATAARRAA